MLFCLLLRLVSLLGPLGLYGCCLGAWRICALIVHACLDTFCLLLRPVSLDCLWGVLADLARQVLVYRLHRPQGPRDALLALCDSTLARRTHAARSGIRAVIEFLPERLNLDLGLLQQVLQGLAAPETGSARMGTHAHAVMGHPVHADQALRQQGCHVAGQLRVEPLRVHEPKVAQRVVVYADPTAQPAVGVLTVAQPCKFARRTYPVERRVQPQTHQDGRVNGSAPDTAFDGPDARVQSLKVDRLHEGPDGAGLVVCGQGGVKVIGTQFDLIAYRALHAGYAFERSWFRGCCAVGRQHQVLKQGVHVSARSGFRGGADHVKKHAIFVPTYLHRL